MRRGIFGKELIKDFATGELVGINLGSNFCAEHEYGIQPIQETLGIPTITRKAGVKARQITKFKAENFIYKINGYYSYLIFQIWPFGGDKMVHFTELMPNPNEISTAWSSTDFGLVAPKPYKDFVKELWCAFQEKDIALGLGKSSANPFINPGLVILIISKAPLEMIAAIEHEDMLLEGVKSKTK